MTGSDRPTPIARQEIPVAATMPPALRALSVEIASPSVARSLERLSDRIASGEPWDAALSARDVRLPLHLRALLQASMRTERLPHSLAQLVDLDRRRNQLRREIRLSLAYPLVLLAVLGVLFVLYEFYFIREVMALHTEMLTDFRLLSSPAAQLPSVTQVAIYLSRPIPLASIIVVMTVTALVVLVSQTMRVRWIDALFNRLPVLGSLWRWSALADSVRILALLLDAEIPLPKALGMAATAALDAEVAAGCWDLADHVQSGRGMADAIEAGSPFPPTLAPLVRWGESHSALPGALVAAAEMLEGRVRVQLGFVRTFMPPMLFLVVASAIFCSLLAAFYPMFRLVESLA